MTSGVAALSFTRVGGEEIRKAVGHELGHPHFVGTIDAFLFRYVIRPFLRSTFEWFAAPRIAVADAGAEYWGKAGPKADASVGKGINIFGCVSLGEENGQAILAHKPHPAQPLRLLTGDALAKVKAAKEKLWESRGLLTHSDAALWATKILEHQTFGSTIRSEIVRRFPFVVVDELQDTGHYLGKAIRLVFGDSGVEDSLLVIQTKPSTSSRAHAHSYLRR